MSFPRNKREAAPVEETAADFYDRTVAVLMQARVERSEVALRRAKIRLDGERYKSLSVDRRDYLSELYRQAAIACGMGAP